MASTNTASFDTGNGAQLIIDLTRTDLPVGTPVYVYIVGLVTNTYYYIDQNGQPQIMQQSDNTEAAGDFPGKSGLSSAAQTIISANYPSSWANYSIPVPVGGNLILPLGAINTTNIPGLGTGTAAFSGRVYISAGVPILPFTVVSGGYTAPVFGTSASGNAYGQPGSLCLYDWIEFSYDSNGNFNGNTTQVNQFAIPLSLNGTDTNKVTTPTQGELKAPQTAIMDDINAAASPFGGSLVMVPIDSSASEAYPFGVSYYRAVAPVTVEPSPQVPTSLSTYFDADLTKAYTAWSSTPLVTNDVATGYYTGVVFPVSGATIDPPTGYTTGSLAFYEGNFATMADLATALKSSNPPAFAFCLTGASAQITTSDIWECAGSLASGTPAQKNVGKMIAAAFNRGVAVNASGNVISSLDDGTCAGMRGQFYGKGTAYNQWSEWFHGYNTNGLAYGFPYDDVCDQNPSISLKAQFVRITMGMFGINDL